jgi:hypothetical protein
MGAEARYILHTFSTRSPYVLHISGVFIFPLVSLQAPKAFSKIGARETLIVLILVESTVGGCSARAIDQELEMSIVIREQKQPW